MGREGYCPVMANSYGPGGCTAKSGVHQSPVQASQCPAHGGPNRAAPLKNMKPSDMIGLPPKNRAAAAHHRHTPVPVLSSLAKDDDATVRENAASNSHTPVEDLVRLASDPDPAVRRAVAGNPHLPAEQRWEMYRAEPDGEVAAVLAGAAKTPKDLLREMLDSPSDRVVEMASSRNSSMTLEILLDADWQKPGNFQIAYAIAERKSAPTEVLIHVAENWPEGVSHYAMQRVVKHPKMPEKYLRAYLEEFPRQLDGVYTHPAIT